jgi:hypothetical protein
VNSVSPHEKNKKSAENNIKISVPNYIDRYEVGANQDCYIIKNLICNNK